MAHAHEPKLQHAHHHGPNSPLVYVKVFALLLVLMVATIWWYFFAPAQFGDAPWVSYMNNIVAMGIAVIKACAVIYIFMGYKYSTNLVKLYTLLGFIWVTLMLIVFCDYGTRYLEPNRGWEGGEKTKWLQTVPTDQSQRPYDPPVLVK